MHSDILFALMDNIKTCSIIKIHNNREDIMKKTYIAGLALVPVLFLGGCATDGAYYSTSPNYVYYNPNVQYSNYSTVGYGVGYGNYYHRGWNNWNGYRTGYHNASWGYHGGAYNAGRSYRTVGYRGAGGYHGGYHRGGFHGGRGRR